MDPSLFVLFIILFLLSAFFSGTEIALMGIAEHKIQSLVKQGTFGAKSLKRIKANNDRLLIAILIGNNLANVSTATLATGMAIGISQASGMSSSYAVGVSTGVVTFLILLFGEIVPKSFATRNAGLISTAVAPLYEVLLCAGYPVIIIIEVIIKLFSRNNKVESIPNEEIKSFIDMGRKSGSLKQGEHEKIKNILEFSRTTSEEIMTPRVEIEALPSDTTVGEALEYYISHTHSRIPIYHKTIDKIEYFMTIRHIITEDKNKKLSELELPKVLKVPLNKPVSKLLNTFQSSTKHMAILIDEYGGVEGLITLEDVVEEIFGDIRDETDKETDEIKKIGDMIFISESSVLLSDILDKFHLDFQDIGIDVKEFGGQTLSYLITHRLERFPTVGEVISFDILDFGKGGPVERFVLTVGDIHESKIGKVQIKKETITDHTL